MTETGVSDSQREHSGGNHSSGSFFKKNKKGILIAGGVGGVLLLSSKGKSSSSGSSSTSDQAAQDALAQQTAALESGQIYPPAAYDTSTGSGTDTSGTDTSGNGADSSLDTSASPPTQDQTPTGQVGPININIPANEPATPKNKPSRHGKTNNRHKGQKIQDPHHTGHHTGGGVTVHGRTFPGAVGHVKHPAKRHGRDIHQPITVHYGGHSSTHISVNNGRGWIDHPKGSTPPSRGVPASHGTTHHIIDKPVNRKPVVVRAPTHRPPVRHVAKRK